MSESTEQQFLDKLGKLDKLFRLAWALFIGAFAIGVWVTTLQLQASELEEKTAHLEANSNEFDKWRIAVDNTRWSMANQNKFMTDLTHQLSEQKFIAEKRLQRLEDTQLSIMKILTKIDKATSE